MKTVEKKLKEYLGYEKEIKKLKNTRRTGCDLSYGPVM